MIRIYCYYSYGGYKTFYINGDKEELINQEVKIGQEMDFPADAALYFRYSGVKMAYHKLSSGEYTVVIKDLPSIHKDSAGRSINCGFQFIGDKCDKQLLDNLTISIANNIDGFGEFISNLFFVNDGLRLDGDKLRDFINSFDGQMVISEGNASKLLGIKNVDSGVILLVPEYGSYLTDSRESDSLNKNLRYNTTDLRRTIVIPYNDLNKQSKSIRFKIEDTPQSLDSADTIGNDSTPSHKSIVSKVVDELNRPENKKAIKDKITEVVSNIGKPRDMSNDNEIKRLELKIERMQKEISLMRSKESSLASENSNLKAKCTKQLYAIVACLVVILLLFLFKQ